MLSKEQIIIVRIWEGLGNQLFQYAYARALQEQGLNVKLDLKKAYDEVFPQIASIPGDRIIFRILT